MTAAPSGAPFLTVPDHLDGARPASLGARLWALVLDGFFLVLFEVLLFGSILIGAWAATASGSDSLGLAVTLVVIGLVIAVHVKFWVVALWRNGQTPGMRAAGVVWARWSVPGRPGGHTLGKLVIQTLVSSVTGGLANLVIYLVSRDAYGRFWFDRVSDLIAVDARSGTNPVTAGQAAAAGAVAPGPGAVSPAAITPPSPPVLDPALDPVLSLSDPPAPATEPDLPTGGPSDAVADADPGTPLAPVPMRTATPTGTAPAPVGGAPTPVPPPAAPPAGPAAAPAATPTGEDSGLITAVPWQSPAPTRTATFAPTGGSPAAPSARTGEATAGGQPLAPPGTTAGSSAQAPLVVPLSSRANGSVAGTLEDDAMERTVARPITLPTLRLRLDSGESIPLTGTVLLGRDPAAVDPWTGATLVPVADPERSISKTHLAVILQGSRALVQDLGSTNGTLVVNPDGALTHVLPGTPVDAPVGATVRFGERSLTVER